MNTEQMRHGLRRLDTRAATIDAIVDAGEAATGDVLPLLQDRNESVRWSAIKILSEIGDTQAVAPLIALVEQSKNATDAVNALRAITGQGLGNDPAEWRNWLMQDPLLRSSTGTGLLSDEELVVAATRDLPATVTSEGQEYWVAVSLPNGRSQQVWIDFSRKDPSGRPLVQLCAACGKADPERYEAALKLNMSIPFGAIAIAATDETPCFAIVDSYLRSIVHPEDIAESIMSLAVNGGSIESLFAE